VYKRQSLNRPDHCCSSGYGEKKDIAEGWTLSSLHQLNHINPNLLRKGDGTIVKNSIHIINAIAGNGVAGYGICDNGDPAMYAVGELNRESVENGEENPSNTELCGDGMVARQLRPVLIFPMESS
jgi:hypothetical protein